MAKHKVVKAKAKASKAVNPVTISKAIPKDEPKAMVNTVQAFVYPNKGKYEIDHVKVNLKGKDETFTALSKAKLDINGLKINDMLKALFVGLVTHNVTKFMYGYKNVYGYAFGIVPKGFNSYKAVIAHHNGDGQRSLIINANKHFGMGEIEKALTKVKVSYENHKTYTKLYVSKENIDNVTKACQSLCECTLTVAG